MPRAPASSPPRDTAPGAGRRPGEHLGHLGFLTVLAFRSSSPGISQTPAMTSASRKVGSGWGAGRLCPKVMNPEPHRPRSEGARTSLVPVSQPHHEFSPPENPQPCMVGAPGPQFCTGENGAPRVRPFPQEAQAAQPAGGAGVSQADPVGHGSLKHTRGCVPGSGWAWCGCLPPVPSPLSVT